MEILQGNMKGDIQLGHSSITITYDVHGHRFHDSAKDVDVMDEMEPGLMAA